MYSKLIAIVVMMAVALIMPGELNGLSLAIVQNRHFEVNNGTVSRTTLVASCYNSQYTYYSAKICNSVTDCSNADCPTADPLDTTEIDRKNYVNRMVAIIVPSVVGGLLFICCCCGVCGLYYGSTYFMEWRAKQKRMKPKVQPKKHQEKKRIEDSSDSSFDRSHMRKH